MHAWTDDFSLHARHAGSDLVRINSCGSDFSGGDGGLDIEEEGSSSRRDHGHAHGWRGGDPDDDGSSSNDESEGSEGAMLIHSAPPSIYEVREASFAHEIRLILQSGIPVSLATLCRLLVLTTDIVFLGHLGTVYLAAAALAQVWQSVMMTAIFGAAVALNGLCAQVA
jgi:hypothetical protein